MIPYAMHDEGLLRVLPLPRGGTRSAYDADGLMPGSERAERWLFWPMGIASAGQMRQWGRHATAFVGRRHFDDAGLLDLYFAPRTTGAPIGRQTLKLRVATYNIHKGITGIRRRPRIHDVKLALNTIDADIVFLQEVQDRNEMMRKHADYPSARQLDFLATGGYEHSPTA